MPATAYITHPDCERHDMGEGHPERPARLAAINDRLVATGLLGLCDTREAPLATRAQLAAAHDRAYVDQIFQLAPSEGLVRLDPDTAMNPWTLAAARRAAGAVILGVDLAIAGEVRNAFCAVRPPGHHAERHRAMGFCLFGNVAVGARHALAVHGLERVAIADFDVHHGNGTEDLVAGDDRILFCSTFQHPYYPFSGATSRASNLVNVPLEAGTRSAAFRTAVSEHWLPALEAFAPQLVLVSAGFDAHLADPLAGLRLTEEDFHWVTARLCEQADASADGRLVASLEGGYDLDALGRCAEAHLRALLGEPWR